MRTDLRLALRMRQSDDSDQREATLFAYSWRTRPYRRPGKAGAALQRQMTDGGEVARRRRRLRLDVQLPDRQRRQRLDAGHGRDAGYFQLTGLQPILGTLLLRRKPAAELRPRC